MSMSGKRRNSSRHEIILVAVIALVVLAIPVSASTYDAGWPGERNLGDPYLFTIHNVSGRADITYNVTVYDYVIIGDSYQYWSVDWGRWLTTYAPWGKKYLAIWAKVDSKGTSWFPWESTNFHVWCWGNISLQNISIPMNDLPEQIKGENYRPAVIWELQNRTGRNNVLLKDDWYGWVDDHPLNRQLPGDSSSWDGVILYEIPYNVPDTEIRVCADFGYFGYATYYLTPHKTLIKQRPGFAKEKVTVSTELPSVRGLQIRSLETR